MKPGTPNLTARTASSWLSEDPGFVDLARRVDDLVAIQQALGRACPDIRATVAGLSAGVLDLSVPAAAWASRLRQTEPSIVAALAREGFRVNRLKIRPTRQIPVPAPRLQARSPIPPTALSRLAEVESSLEPGPLQQAISQLLARRTRAGAGQS